MTLIFPLIFYYITHFVRKQLSLQYICGFWFYLQLIATDLHSGQASHYSLSKLNKSDEFYSVLTFFPHILTFKHISDVSTQPLTSTPATNLLYNTCGEITIAQETILQTTNGRFSLVTEEQTNGFVKQCQICHSQNHMSPLFERLELLLPRQSPVVNTLFPARITSVQALIMSGQPYRHCNSWHHMSPEFKFWLSF